MKRKAVFLLFVLGLLTSPLMVVAQDGLPVLEVITPENADKLVKLVVLPQGGSRNEWSPDGRYLAVLGGQPRKLWVFDSVNFHKLPLLFEDTQENSSRVLYGIGGFAFSPVEPILATSDWGGTIRLWSLDSGNELAALYDHNDLVGELAFSPDGRFLASGADAFDSTDSAIRLWDVKSHTLLANLDPQLRINDFAFDPSGKLLASTSVDRSGLIWNIETREVATPLYNENIKVYVVNFSPDGKLLASSALSDTVVALWDTETGLLDTTLESSEGGLAAFSPDNAYIALTNSNGELVMYDRAKNNHLISISIPFPVAQKVSFSSNSSLLMTTSRLDRGIDHVVLVDTDTKQVVVILDDEFGFGVSAKFSPDGKLIAIMDEFTTSLWGVPAEG